MGKGHRDNYAARKKRGPEAFAKKAARRAPDNKVKCNLCGTPTRPHKLQGGLCPPCFAGKR
jgi:hypothetical protein